MLTALADRARRDDGRGHLRAHRHDQQLVRRIFAQSNKGVDAVITAAGGRDRRRRGSRVPGSRFSSGSSGVDGVRPAGGHRRSAGLDHRRRTASHGAVTAPRRLRLLRRSRARSTRSPTCEGHPPQAADEVVDRQGDGRQARASRSATASRSPAAGGQEYTLVGSRRSATSTRSAARRSLMLTLPEAQRLDRQGGQVRPDRRRRRPGRHAGPAGRRICSAALPTSLEVETGAEDAADPADDISEFSAS